MCAKSAELLIEDQPRDGTQTLVAPPPPWGAQVFQINCLMAVHQPLAAYPAAAPKCEHLKTLMDTFLEEMVNGTIGRPRIDLLTVCVYLKLSSPGVLGYCKG